MHGAGAPQVKESARLRLMALAYPAIDGLRKALASEDLTAIVRAAQIVLDRTGHNPKQSFELSGPDGGPLQIEARTKLDRLPVERKRQILAWLTELDEGEPLLEHRT